MMNPELKRMIVADIKELMIPQEDVACLYDFNSLQHALLVLTQANFAMIPVINSQSQMFGLINIAQIIREATTIETIDLHLLEEKRISELELRKPEYVTFEDGIDSLLYYLQDNNFVCVVDNLEDKTFLGIITRHEVLKRLNRFLYELSHSEKAMTHLSHIMAVQEKNQKNKG